MTERRNHMICFRLSTSQMDYLRSMAKAAEKLSLSNFAKSLVLDVMADDRAAHGDPNLGARST